VFAIPKRAARILVVDDEPIVRRFIVATLESRQYTVIQASSGQEALKYFSEHNEVDLILTDILMPDLSGPEMVQTILKLHPSVNVMFMSGTDPDRILMGLPAKQYPVLHKPFTLNALLNAVQDALSN
jgi:two-component system cell cycle sensor histidine kinase/response regulator CckA